jgi:hypothetical protein
MNRLTVFICVALAFVSSAALSQVSGRIALAGSSDGSNCSIVDTEPGIVQVHILVLDVVGLLGIQFVAQKPECWTGATWLSDDVPVPVHIGNTQDPTLGLSVAFGECLNSPVHVGTINYATKGTALPCCAYPIIKATGDNYPEIDGPIVVLCSDPSRVAGIGVDVVINSEPQCPCQSVVPVEKTTWGQVKALYN